MTQTDIKNQILTVVLINCVLISQVKLKVNEKGKEEIILIKPFVVEGKSLSPYLNGYTTQDIFYVQPTKIITFAKPKDELLKKYESLVE
jgi:hypothetical protein